MIKIAYDTNNEPVYDPKAIGGLEQEFDNLQGSGLENKAETEPRRDFIRKMVYVAPVLITYSRADTSFADDEHGRKRGQTSPHPPPGRGRGNHED